MQLTRREFFSMLFGIVGFSVAAGAIVGHELSSSTNKGSTQKQTETANDRYLHEDYQQLEGESRGFSYSQFIDHLNKQNSKGYQIIYDRTLDEQSFMLKIFNTSPVKTLPTTGAINPLWQELERSIVSKTYQQKTINPLAVLTYNQTNQSGFFYFDQNDFSHILKAFPIAALNPGN